MNETDIGFSLDYKGIQKFGDIRLSQSSKVFAIGETGGNIVINARNFRAEAGSQIATVVTNESQDGNIVINAIENIEFIGVDASGNPSALFSQLANNASGKGINSFIFADKLLIKDGAFLFSNNESSGVGGDIVINAKLIESSGANIQNDDPSGIFASTQGIGKAGNIKITTENLSLQNGTQISSSTFGLGTGGNIDITAQGLLNVTGVSKQGNRSSGIFAQTSGERPSGTITLKTSELRLFNGAQISSTTFAQGAAGEMFVEANSIELSGIALDASGEIVSTENAPFVSSGIFAGSERNSLGNAASLTIKTNNLNMRDGAVIQVSIVLMYGRLPLRYSRVCDATEKFHFSRKVF